MRSATGARRARFRVVSGMAMTSRIGLWSAAASASRFSWADRSCAWKSTSARSISMWMISLGPVNTRSAARGATGDRHLEAGAPAGVRRRSDLLGQCQLTGIAEPDRRDRIEPPSKLVSARGCETSASQQRRIADPALHEARLLLTDTRKPCHLSLGEPGRHACDAQLTTECVRQVSGSIEAPGGGRRAQGFHAEIVVAGLYGGVTGGLLAVLVHRRTSRPDSRRKRAGTTGTGAGALALPNQSFRCASRRR
jgi:hypothetical protein